MSRVDEIRKVRSDKKRDVKPFIPWNLYDCVERLAYVTRKPIKDIGEFLCIEGMDSTYVLDCMSAYLVRDLSIVDTNTFYIAQSSSGSRRIKIKNGKKRISIRFKQDDYERLNNLSYAFGLTIASTVTLILIHAARDIDLINKIIEECGTLDNNRLNERRYILKASKKGSWQYETVR